MLWQLLGRGEAPLPCIPPSPHTVHLSCQVTIPCCSFQDRLLGNLPHSLCCAAWLLLGPFSESRQKNMVSYLYERIGYLSLISPAWFIPDSLSLICSSVASVYHDFFFIFILQMETSAVEENVMKSISSCSGYWCAVSALWSVPSAAFLQYLDKIVFPLRSISVSFVKKCSP